MSNPPVNSHLATAAMYAVMENRPGSLIQMLDTMLDDELDEFEDQVSRLLAAVTAARRERRTRKTRRSGKRGTR